MHKIVVEARRALTPRKEKYQWAPPAADDWQFISMPSAHRYVYKSQRRGLLCSFEAEARIRSDLGPTPTSMLIVRRAADVGSFDSMNYELTMYIDQLPPADDVYDVWQHYVSLIDRTVDRLNTYTAADSEWVVSPTQVALRDPTTRTMAELFIIWHDGQFKAHIICDHGFDTDEIIIDDLAISPSVFARTMVKLMIDARDR